MAGHPHACGALVSPAMRRCLYSGHAPCRFLWLGLHSSHTLIHWHGMACHAHALLHASPGIALPWTSCPRPRACIRPWHLIHAHAPLHASMRLAFHSCPWILAYQVKPSASMHALISYRLLSTDQDSVRLLAVESCVSFAQSLSREDAVSQLLPVILKFSQVCTWVCTRVSATSVCPYAHTHIHTHTIGTPLSCYTCTCTRTHALPCAPCRTSRGVSATTLPPSWLSCVRHSGQRCHGTSSRRPLWACCGTARPRWALCLGHEDGWHVHVRDESGRGFPTDVGHSL